ncbi:hypothetical protein [Rhodoferax sp.]|uniref:hypothetical protein n=1 Tax=Rhodoferax sp. TaxID=50421 RepID=UPI0025F485D7|nr:hypothetical protein [Rhodoferax sp.]
MNSGGFVVFTFMSAKSFAVLMARRMGTSPAYITRLFRGNGNLSVQTIASWRGSWVPRWNQG